MKRLRRQQDGNAMVIVLVAVAVMSLFVGVAMTGSTFTLGMSSRTKSFHAAAALAKGALDEYLDRINADPTYSRYADVAAEGCPVSTPVQKDPANPFMNGGAPLQPGDTKRRVSYSLDAAELCRSRTLKLRVTATADGVERRFDYTLKRRGFLDYAYFSDFEALDPTRYATNPWAASGGTVEHQCTRHHYEPTRSLPAVAAPRPESGLNQTPGCATINWITHDFISGPAHSNDALLICGKPTFDGALTSSWQGDGTRRWLPNPGCASNPDFRNAAEECGSMGPCFAPQLALPPGNTSLASVPGACIYTGPTRITLLWAGNVRVTSPYTSSVAAGCSLGGTTRPLPASGLIYVRDVPSTQSTPPCTTPAGYVSPVNAVGFPEHAGDITKYGCRSGDAFVSGNYKGRITIGAQNRLIQVGKSWGDLQSDPNSMLGLVAGDSIELYHPVNAAGDNLDDTPTTLLAAMLAVNGSILLQNHDKGAHLGQLVVIGAMAQKWRGLVGTTDGQHGLAKTYKHDPRLRTAMPPHFIEPIDSDWQVVQAEQPKTP